MDFVPARPESLAGCGPVTRRVVDCLTHGRRPAMYPLSNLGSHPAGARLFTCNIGIRKRYS